MRNSLALAFGVWLLALDSVEALDQSAVNWGHIVGTCVGYVHLKGGRDFEAVPWGTPGQVSVYRTAEEKALFRRCMWVTLKALEDEIDANKHQAADAPGPSTTASLNYTLHPSETAAATRAA